MPEDRPDFTDIQIAYLYQGGATQEEISKELGGMSQSKVSRRIKEAFEIGLLVKSEIEFNPRKIPEQHRLAYESMFGEVSDIPELKEMSKNFKNATVLPTDSFDERVSLIIPDLVAEAKVIGVGFGKTCRRVLDKIKTEKKIGPDTHVIPIQGEPLFFINRNALKYSPSRLAVVLEDALIDKGDRVKVRKETNHSLVGVPAYIGDSKLKDSVEAFYSQLPGYQNIFGKGGLAGKMDCFICGVGMLDPENDDRSGVFIRERIVQLPEQEDRIRKICVGDYGGLLLPRKRSHKAEISKLNQGWVGLTDSRLREVAATWQNGSGPGSIAIAIGEHKAEAILAAVNADYISHLIVDAALARAIKNII